MKLKLDSSPLYYMSNIIIYSFIFSFYLSSGICWYFYCSLYTHYTIHTFFLLYYVSIYLFIYELVHHRKSNRKCSDTEFCHSSNHLYTMSSLIYDCIDFENFVVSIHVPYDSWIWPIFYFIFILLTKTFYSLLFCVLMKCLLTILGFVEKCIWYTSWNEASHKFS